jgi:hypothetical protein
VAGAVETGLVGNYLVALIVVSVLVVASCNKNYIIIPS